MFLLCQEKKIEDKVYNDMLLIADQYNNTVAFKEILRNPIIVPEKKKKAFQTFFQQYIHEITLKFLYTLVDNKREQMLKSIIRNFIDCYKKNIGLKTAILYTATDLDDKYIQSIKIVIEKELKATIELHVKVKEQLIGGFVLMVDGKMMDASIAQKLNELKNKILI